MKLAVFVLTTVIGASALSSVACGGSVEQVQSSSQAASKAPIAPSSHGAIKMVGAALGEVALRPEQRTEIEKLAADAAARHAPLYEGKKQLMLTFADLVETGAIDRATLQTGVDKVAGDLEKSRNDDRAAIVKLHDLLDKQQRGDFVDALEDQFKGKHEGGPRAGFGQLRKLAEDMKLTDDQKDKVKDVFKDAWREGKKEHHGDKHGWGGRGDRKAGKHALEAFRDDKLDLDKALPPMDVKAMASGGVEHVAKIAGKILPILTPEQRKIAADKLREMANSGDSSLLVH